MAAIPTNLTIPDWQQRVRTERAQLQDKIVKLTDALCDTGVVPPEDVPILSMQLDAMRVYRAILDLRIARF